MKLLIITQKVDKNDENLGAFYYWFEEFARRFEKVTIITSHLGEENLPSNVNIFSLGKEFGRGRLGRILVFFFIFSRNYFKSDIVFFHMIPEFVIASAPFLLFLRRKTALWYVHKSVTWKLKIAEKLVDYIFSASEASFRLPSKKVIFTGQAINTNVFSPSLKKERADGAIRFLAVSRISPVKNFDIAIKTFALLKDSWTRRWSFSIVGGPILASDYEYMNSLKRLSEKNALGGFVNFLGPHSFPDIPDIIREHDFFISLSETGSLDKVVLEAMACGLTVLTSTESYKKVLPERYFLGNQEPAFIAEKIKSLADEKRPNLVLREIVVKNHSLERTMKKIISILLKK